MGCFKGSRVSMADGSLKPIEELKVGDEVLDYNKDTQIVDGIRSVRLIPSPQRLTVKINDRYVITDRHCILTEDLKFRQVNDRIARNQWMRLYPYIGENNRIIFKFLYAQDLIDYNLCGELSLDTVIKTINGPEKVYKIEIIDHPDDQLFIHSVTGSGTYFVDGICITARLSEFWDYKEMKPHNRKVNIVSELDQYTKKNKYKRVFDLDPAEKVTRWDYNLENWYNPERGACTPWSINIL